MKWLITFLHNDASWEEVLVDGHRLSAAFRRATALECPCHVLEVKEVPDESVMYCWTEDGDPECCTARGAVFHGEECHHCARPVEGAGVLLTSPEGEGYPLHAGCAYRGCAGYDRDVIAAAVAEADKASGQEGAGRVRYADLLDLATDDVTDWFARCETPKDCEHLARDMRDQLDIVARLRASAIAKVAEAERDTGGAGRERRWRVTVLRGDGKWVPVDIGAGSQAEAVDAALALDWAENVIECEPLATLGEEVPVEPEGGDPVRAVALAEVGGTRRWVVNGDPEEDWWAEVDETGRHLPGDWEYDRDEGVVVCSLVPA